MSITALIPCMVCTNTAKHYDEAGNPYCYPHWLATRQHVAGAADRESDPSLPITLRTRQSEAIYAREKASGNLRPLHEEPSLAQFKRWRIIANRFPYDLAFDVSHLLLPNRVVAEKRELTMAELHELDQLMRVYVPEHYNAVLENLGVRRSVSGHYHIHLLRFKEVA